MTTDAHCPKTNGLYIELVYTVLGKMSYLLKGCVWTRAIIQNCV